MSSIEWTDETWGVAVGCKMVSEGCRNCYAQAFAHRGLAEQHRGLTVMTSQGPRWNGTARFVPEVLSKPLSWRKPRKVFVASMSDLFHDDITNEQIAAVFGVMAACPQHTFQVLTKRPERMQAWFKQMPPDAWHANELAKACAREFGVARDALNARHSDPWPLPNVWTGVSVENQEAAKRALYLVGEDDDGNPGIPAAVRFLSIEPMISHVDLRHVVFAEPKGYAPGVRIDVLTGHVEGPDEFLTHKIDWVIVGGESGPGARPCDVAWIRSIVEQCKAASVPVFVKQLGSRPIGEWGGDNTPKCHVTDITVDPPETRIEEHRTKGGVWKLCDRKGGTMEEWPSDLRIRQFPGGAT